MFDEGGARADEARNGVRELGAVSGRLGVEEDEADAPLAVACGVMSEQPSEREVCGHKHARTHTATATLTLYEDDVVANEVEEGVFHGKDMAPALP